MIRELVRILEGRGYGGIRAARLPEYESCRPKAILWDSSDEGYTPDIWARKNGNDFLFQVETAATLREIDKRVILFATFARHFRKQFCLVVPAGCVGTTKDKLGALKVNERFIHVLGM